MSKEFALFQKDTLTFGEKFYVLMDLLLSNQNPSRMECIIFLGISYIQIISGFFAEQIEVFEKKKSKSDKILYYFQQILRFKDLFIDKYSEFKICIIVFFTLIFLFTIFFFITCSKIKKNSFYSYNELIINYFIKCFIYIFFNIILDLVFSIFCFGEDEFNPYFSKVKCSLKDNLTIVIISILLLIISIILIFLIQCFYCDSIYLSTSFYSRISCNYEIYSTLNSICFSIFLIQAKYLSKEIFLLYNIIISALFFHFYINHYLYYDKVTNNLVGLFHILYLWTSFFCLLFAYIDFNEKGIIYMVSSSIILYFYFNLKYKIEENIFLDTPFYKITNKNYFLYYIKNLIDKINHIDEKPEDKALLAGIMQMHAIECPNPECLSKTKNKLYLPITNEWSDRTKPNIEDRVYLISFIIIIMNYFITQNYYSPDMIINLSVYYLDIIGNYCLAMYYYKKVKEMKLTLQEQSSFERLKLKISKALVEKLKPPNENCTSLEDLNVTIYFKYDDLSQSFVDEMNNDVNLSLEFWKIFRNSQLDFNKQIDFNKIFHLTDKIRITKRKVEKLWDKLLLIYNGVNDLFDLYSEYVEQLNDDDLKKRDLESIRRKNENFSEHISQNYYLMLFNKDTGIIIANGDKGKEGLIEKTNAEVENIFKYKPEELKGMNLSVLMPKNYAKLHKTFMERYYNIGEKIAIDKKNLKGFAKDKDNAIVMLKIVLKLFPMLNENVYFIGIFSKENIDDIIYIDGKFNIQGMSMKLMKILNIDNKLLFQDNDIPFYVICKKFVNFYKIFLQGKKQNVKEKVKKSPSLLLESSSGDNNIEEDSNKNNNETQNEKETELHENIEINENIELEYEIRLPQFLIDYSELTNKKDRIDRNKGMIPGGTIENLSEKGIDDFNNETIEEFGESDLLVDNSDNKDSKISNNNNTNININNNNNNNNNNTPNNITPENITPTPTPNPYVITVNKSNNNENNGNNNFNNLINQNKNDLNKQSDEEKDFGIKVQKYKELFELGKFDELEDFIDSCNAETLSSEYKFNFTFDRYKFGNKNMSYIVRCIDNKNDGSNSEEESFGDADPKIAKYKKEKAAAIKPLFEILDDEKKNLLSQVENFFHLSIGNKNFQNLLNLCKEDINKMSMVHGTKKDEIQDDENASQTSQAGFNSDLVKKNRIEEIRANILNNISNFYTLKYLKISVFLISLFTLIYGIIYLILFFRIYDDLKMVSKLNIDLFQTTTWMTNLIGTLVSLRALFNKTKNEIEYDFNSFIQDNDIYFINMKKIGYLWYSNITLSFGELEHKIGKYLNRENQIKYFWDNENVTYYYQNINSDTESFPLGLSQIMSDINSLLMNSNFCLSNDTNLSNNIETYLEYISFLSIENAYDNLIPNQYIKILKIPKLLQDYNKSSKMILIIFLLIYSGLMVFFCVLYSIFLHTTNENMGEGLEKVTKIKLEKIEETIKKIETFNITLKKFRERDSQKITNQNENQNEKNNIDNTKTQNSQIQNLNETNQSVNTNGFNTDTKKYIPLKILTFSYLQTAILFCILCACLIPIYLITDSMVVSTNKLINVENYMFGKILTASASTLKIKCNMSECDIKNDLNYSGIVDKSQIQKIVQGISIFNDLNIFYNEQFLLNACKSVYNTNTSDYDDCMNDELVQSANNTDSLLKLIDETVDNIYKEREMNENNENYILKNGQNVIFNSIYLYESESFKDLETVFYKYIAPVSDNFSKICISSLSSYLKKKKNIVVLLIVIFCIMVILLCLYMAFCFVNKLIHLLSVSRCILKIIPTTVINNTQELENWIENKY